MLSTLLSFNILIDIVNDVQNLNIRSGEEYDSDDEEAGTTNNNTEQNFSVSVVSDMMNVSNYKS
jgi:hypothetical protein